jgi:hypothetical protein
VVNVRGGGGAYDANALLVEGELGGARVLGEGVGGGICHGPVRVGGGLRGRHCKIEGEMVEEGI